MIEVRAVAGEELFEVAFELRQYAFLTTPATVDEKEFRELYTALDGHRSLVLFEDGRPMATAAVHAMTQNVRGTMQPMAGVAAVAAHPEIRRKGHVRRLLRQLLTEQAADGATVSCLYAFRESFYNRFGYVGLPLMKEAAIEVANLAPLLATEPAGSVRLLERAEGLPALREVLRSLQPDVHGMAMRNWVPDRPWPGSAGHWYAVARDDSGAVTGVLPYQLDLDQLELRATEMVWATTPGRYQLLHWIARHVDHVRTARLPLPAGCYPETWLADLRVSFRQYEAESSMARVLSVPALSGAAVGPAAGSAGLVVRVIDPLIPANDRVWALRADDGRLEVTEGGPAERAECTLTIEGLSALVYGGYDPADLTSRGWGDPAGDPQRRLHALFPPAVPHLYEHF